MATTTVAVIVGSLRKDSYNRQLAQAMAKMAPAGLVLQEVSIADLPLYNQDHDGAEVPAVLAFRDAVRAAHAVLFVTPEYNRSMPGALKNALDQGSRPYGQSVWAGKPAAVIGMSPGAIGTALAQQHLRNVLSHLDMPTLGQPEMFVQYKDGFFNADGSVGEGSAKYVDRFLQRFAAWVAQHRA